MNKFKGTGRTRSPDNTLTNDVSTPGSSFTLGLNEIINCIFTVRGQQVMLDSHLAEMYQVKTKRLNEQVNRNIERFPEHFRFQLSEKEYEQIKEHMQNSPGTRLLRSQNATLEDGKGKHRKYLPYVFTEQGVAMLSAVLRSKVAIESSIQIIDAFVEMRKVLHNNAALFKRIDTIENKQLETDRKFEKVFRALESGKPKPDKGIFFQGQIFDAYLFVAGIIKNAQKEILLVDNFVDESVLDLLSKRKKGVKVVVYTRAISKQLALDVKKHNAQFTSVEVKKMKESHDRFLIIDRNQLYHIGASLKDLGKKWFAFSKMNMFLRDVLNRLP